MTEVTRTFAPKELAAVIGVDPKVLRGHLRATYARPLEAKNTTWIIPADVANECIDFFAKRRAIALVPVVAPIDPNTDEDTSANGEAYDGD